MESGGVLLAGRGEKDTLFFSYAFSEGIQLLSLEGHLHFVTHIKTALKRHRVI